MRVKIAVLLVIIGVFSCKEEEKTVSSIKPINWIKHTVNFEMDSMNESGSTYLPIYSKVYSQTEQIKLSLTTTVSLRNMNPRDTLIIENARYFNKGGKPIRTYFEKPIFLKPLETINIIIDQYDREGDTGASFVFDWKKKLDAHEPLFEAIMISALGTQGLSFKTKGKRIK